MHESIKTNYDQIVSLIELSETFIQTTNSMSNFLNNTPVNDLLSLISNTVKTAKKMLEPAREDRSLSQNYFSQIRTLFIDTLEHFQSIIHIITQSANDQQNNNNPMGVYQIDALNSLLKRLKELCGLDQTIQVCQPLIDENKVIIKSNYNIFLRSIDALRSAIETVNLDNLTEEQRKNISDAKIQIERIEAALNKTIEENGTDFLTDQQFNALNEFKLEVLTETLAGKIEFILSLPEIIQDWHHFSTLHEIKQSASASRLDSRTDNKRIRDEETLFAEIKRTKVDYMHYALDNAATEVLSGLKIISNKYTKNEDGSDKNIASERFEAVVRLRRLIGVFTNISIEKTNIKSLQDNFHLVQKAAWLVFSQFPEEDSTILNSLKHKIDEMQNFINNYVRKEFKVISFPIANLSYPELPDNFVSKFDILLSSLNELQSRISVLDEKGELEDNDRAALLALKYVVDRLQTFKMKNLFHDFSFLINLDKQLEIVAANAITFKLKDNMLPIARSLSQIVSSYLYNEYLPHPDLVTMDDESLNAFLHFWETAKGQKFDLAEDHPELAKEVGMLLDIYATCDLIMPKEIQTIETIEILGAVVDGLDDSIVPEICELKQAHQSFLEQIRRQNSKLASSQANNVLTRYSGLNFFPNSSANANNDEQENQDRKTNSPKMTFMD